MTTRKLLPYGTLLILAVILGACTYQPVYTPAPYQGPIAVDPGPNGYPDPDGYPGQGTIDAGQGSIDQGPVVVDPGQINIDPGANVGYGEYDPSLDCWVWIGPIPPYGSPLWYNYYQGFTSHGWYDRGHGLWHNGHGGWGNGPAPGGSRGPGGTVFAQPPVREPLPGRPPVEGPGFGRQPGGGDFGRQPVTGGFGRQPGGERGPSGGVRGRVFVPRG